MGVGPEPATGSVDKILLQTYADADWGGDREDRKSVSGYLVMIGGAVICSASKKQNSVALSSCEAELYALTAAAAEALAVAELLRELLYGVVARAATDSDAARAVTGRRGAGTGLKHVELRRLCVQDWVATNRLEVHREPGVSSVADIGTKHLPCERLRALASYRRP